MKIGDVKIGEAYWARQLRYGNGYAVKAVAIETREVKGLWPSRQAPRKVRFVRVEVIEEGVDKKVGDTFTVEANRIWGGLDEYRKHEKLRAAHQSERELRERARMHLAEDIASMIGVEFKKVRPSYADVPEQYRNEFCYDTAVEVYASSDGFSVTFNEHAFEALLRQLGFNVSTELKKLLVKVDVPE